MCLGAVPVVPDKKVITAYVGGAMDSTSRIMLNIFERHKVFDDAYFEWTQGKALSSWIAAHSDYDKRVKVVGHSYGGHTAARVIARGQRVDPYDGDIIRMFTAGV